MNILRLTTIIFSLTLLIACGGGGGGGGTATAPTTMPPTGLQDLPAALITNVATARSRVSGSSTPATTDPTEIQEAFQMEAMDANTLVASDAFFKTPSMTQGTDALSSRIVIGDIIFRASLDDIRMGMADRFNLTGFDSQYTPVMDHGGTTLAQYRAAGRIDEYANFEYLSYGGWLTNSAFSVDILTVDAFAGDGETSILVGLSYGDATGSRPTTGSGRWGGTMVGVHKRMGYLVQGSADIRINSFADNTLTILNLFNIKRLDNGADVANLDWTAVPINADGTFASSSGDVSGAFYGENHEEIGGVFNREDIIGSFGGPRVSQ